MANNKQSYDSSIQEVLARGLKVPPLETLRDFSGEVLKGTPVLVYRGLVYPKLKFSKFFVDTYYVGIVLSPFTLEVKLDKKFNIKAFNHRPYFDPYVIYSYSPKGTLHNTYSLKDKDHFLGFKNDGDVYYKNSHRHENPKVEVIRRYWHEQQNKLFCYSLKKPNRNKFYIIEEKIITPEIEVTFL